MRNINNICECARERGIPKCAECFAERMEILLERKIIRVESPKLPEPDAERVGRGRTAEDSDTTSSETTR